MKYMFLFKDIEEVEQSKRSRTTNTAIQVGASGLMQSSHPCRLQPRLLSLLLCL